MASTTPLTFIRVVGVTVSLELPEQTKRLTSGTLCIGPNQYKLICLDDGTLRQEFKNVVLSPDAQITLRYKTSSSSKKKTQRIDTHRLFTSFYASQTQDVSTAQDGIQVTFSCRATRTNLPMILTAGTLTTQVIEPSTPVTRAIFERRPLFRILAIGKSGAGKSSLINAAFGTGDMYPSHLVRGKADIQEPLMSPINKSLAVHDSLGFEPGDGFNYDTVKEFIQSRKTGVLEERLHAVWFCVRIPRAGARLLEAAAEDFFRTKKETMGSIPLIVVYTKLDLAVNERVLKSKSFYPTLGEENLRELALSEINSSVNELHYEIKNIAREPIPYAVVSIRENYEHTIQDLIELTRGQLGVHDIPEAKTTLFAFQSVAPSLKLKGSIDVGRQHYWKVLRTCFSEKSAILDRLCLIHIDIVAVWNFNDPTGLLRCSEFKELVIKMVQETETSSISPNRIPALGRGSLKNVQQIFMVFMVDLIHIMHTLSTLSAGGHGRLTRRAIKLAYYAYRSSDVMRKAHTVIQEYRDLNGRDAALRMTESLVNPEQYGDPSAREYYAEISKLNLRKLNLDREEEW